MSPDSIVPDPTNPQSFNRYSYVRNNPINFTDPTGHCEENHDEGCWGLAEQLDREYGIGLEYLGSLSYEQLSNADYAAVLAFSLKQLNSVMEGNLTEFDAMENILNFSIYEVAGGDGIRGLGMTASVFFRQLTYDLVGKDVIQGYNIQQFRDEFGEFNTNSGFASKFRDQNGNQVEHFINEAYIIAQYGDRPGSVPNAPLSAELFGNLAVVAFEFSHLKNPDRVPDILTGWVATDYAGDLLRGDRVGADYHLNRLREQ